MEHIPALIGKGVDSTDCLGTPLLPDSVRQADQCLKFETKKVNLNMKNVAKYDEEM